jgi:hypothetical protein
LVECAGLHPYAPVYHEYTHFVLQRAGGWMPVWLGEGLAEYFQTVEIAKEEIRIGKADASNVKFLEHNPLLPLATLFAVDQHSPYYHEDEKTSIFYSESWALTHYSPSAEYTQEARQARREGVCILTMIVGVDNRPRNIVVTKRLGMGLDEKQWRRCNNGSLSLAVGMGGRSRRTSI